MKTHRVTKAERERVKAAKASTKKDPVPEQPAKPDLDALIWSGPTITSNEVFASLATWTEALGIYHVARVHPRYDDVDHYYIAEKLRPTASGHYFDSIEKDSAQRFKRYQTLQEALDVVLKHHLAQTERREVATNAEEIVIAESRDRATVLRAEHVKAFGSAPNNRPEDDCLGTTNHSEDPMSKKKTTNGKTSPKTHKAAKADKKMSAIDAAAKVLAEHGEPMGCQEMVDAAAKKGYWSSPNGKTPAATLYSAILREIKNKGKGSRFTKTDKGKFALATKYPAKV